MRIIMAALIALWTTTADAAVVFDPDTNSMTINGSTSVWQFAEVTRALGEHDPDTVFLYGPGGDYYAGLRIGRALAQEGVRVIIPRDQMCASACALIALAADDLLIDGEAVFHKPFTNGVPSNVTIEDIAAHYGGAYIDMTEYLLDVGRNIDFARRIIAETGRCVWLVADEQSSLDNMRLEDRCVDQQAMRPTARPDNYTGAR